MKSKHHLIAFFINFLLTGVVEIQPAQESLKPQRVRFQSRNFHNILHWQPGKVLLDNYSIYFVQYKMYGQTKWINKEDCWGIQEPFCDLTNETSDIQELYYGRVRAAVAEIHSSWSVSPRFTPWWERIKKIYKISPGYGTILEAQPWMSLLGSWTLSSDMVSPALIASVIQYAWYLCKNSHCTFDLETSSSTEKCGFVYLAVIGVNENKQ
ncbi:interleukin-22 receptor subunit alpha-2 [Orycteropus afer afer]|uniref:Interleukin-22 receptor subunit alpha-2 n=1 Tax=Orycteropus afer afer TaxID=1230840 RepID=A0A8B7A958_ORYAF|nr:interleukin-22 receptor subunit alpha-2 [Orycteropus afer afer]